MQFYPWVYAILGIAGGWWLKATEAEIEKRIKKNRPQRGNAVRR